MIETGHYEAITARSACTAGQFKLCGKTLLPFSFRHQMQLDALGCNLWTYDEDVELADFILAAQICSQPDFITALPQTPTAEEIARFDLADALSVWTEYLRVCYGTRPRLWKLPEGRASHCRAPFEEYIVTYIMRGLPAYTREQLYTMPIAEVLWIYESLGEQLSDRSRILTEEDAAFLERENSPEGTKAREQKEKLAGQIIAHMRKVGTEKQMLDLLNKLENGKLPKDWKKKAKARRGGKNA